MKKRFFALLAVTLLGLASAAAVTSVTTPGNQTDGRSWSWDE